MSKFRKLAAGSTPGISLPSGKTFMDWLLQDQGATDIFDDATTKQQLQFLTALMPGWTTDRYTPSAFIRALELDKNKGYDNTKHSQGAYEMLSPEILKKIEEFKKNPPKDLKDLVTGEPIDKIENPNVPEESERYKSYREKLYPKSAQDKTKFVKTSANTQVDQLKKMVPNWSIENVLNDMAKVANRSDLSTAEKQQNMVAVLSRYEEDIAPLSDYLKKNGIKFK